MPDQAKTYHLMFRHRAMAEAGGEDAPEALHARLIAAMTQIAPPWGLAGVEAPAPDLPPEAGELVRVVPFKALSGSGLRSYVSYKLREPGYLSRDTAQNDDFLSIEFRPQTDDLSALIDQVFPAYIAALSCYRATLSDREGERADWPGISETVTRTGKDIDGRDGVFRLGEITFLDRELCQRAFDRTPEGVLERLPGTGAQGTLLGGGVLLVLSRSLLEHEERRARGDALRKRLVRRGFLSKLLG